MTHFSGIKANNTNHLLKVFQKLQQVDHPNRKRKKNIIHKLQKKKYSNESIISNNCNLK
jgi:predicted Ser/Thr protein kinase